MDGYITGAGNRLLSDGSWNYVYDANGNMTKQIAMGGGYEIDYSCDNRNRLLSVKNYNVSGTTLTQTQEVDYRYDMFDRLIGRSYSWYDGSLAVTTTSAFVYDGQNMVLAFNGTGALTDRYLWGPAVDQILADEQFNPSTSGEMPTSAGNTEWMITDNEGSVRDVVTYTALIDHVVYDAFGKITSGGAPTQFLHNGTFYDPYTGLELHDARWYNPSIQRWMSQDPAGLGPGANPYEYCGNSPTNYVDPSGLMFTIKSFTINSVDAVLTDSNNQTYNATKGKRGPPSLKNLSLTALRTALNSALKKLEWPTTGPISTVLTLSPEIANKLTFKSLDGVANITVTTSDNQPVTVDVNLVHQSWNLTGPGITVPKDDEIMRQIRQLQTDLNNLTNDEIKKLIIKRLTQ